MKHQWNRPGQEPFEGQRVVVLSRNRDSYDRSRGVYSEGEFYSGGYGRSFIIKNVRGWVSDPSSQIGKYKL